jgi:opacity protein-like surface antigen
MRNLMLLSACLLACSGAANAAAKSPPAQATCAAKYYSDYVGRDVSETRTITGDDYRALPAGSSTGATKPSRVTFTYDKKSNKIVDVACG